MSSLTLSNGTQIDPTSLDSSPFDPTVAGLAKKIKGLEGGDYQNRSGDSGSSAGAYQWNNDNKPLRPGELPSHWKNAAAQYLKDPNAPMTPENQNYIAYQQIKAYKEQGRTPTEIDALWNSAKKDSTTGTYVHVSKEREAKFTGAQTDNSSGAKFPFKSQADAQKDQTSGSSGDTTQNITANLGAAEQQKFGPIAGSALGVAASFTPGSKLAEGLGYALSNAAGTQDDFIKTQDDNRDIQTQLLQKIKENKTQGKDTSRLESALTSLTSELNQEGDQASNVGTGGITNKEVLKSSASLASLPALAYGGGLIGDILKGGGEIQKPLIQSILREGSNLLPEEATNTLVKQTAKEILEDKLKNLTVKESGGKVEQSILKALSELEPQLAQKGSGILPKLAKGGFNLAKNAVLTKVLGDTIGSAVHKITQ